MKSSLGAHCDDFQASCRLSLKLNLALERETVLQCFERIRSEYPTMKRFRRRQDGSFFLEEEDPAAGLGSRRRWVRLDSNALRFGFFNPPAPEAWSEYGRAMLDFLPSYLSLYDLDFEHLEVIYSCDMEYRGNHDQLVGETLFADHPLTALLGGESAHARIIDCQPYIGIALSESCDLQAYLDIKSRTSTLEVRTEEYESQVLSVYLTLRQYWGFDQATTLTRCFRRLNATAERLAQTRVVPQVVNPLAMAIASRS